MTEQEFDLIRMAIKSAYPTANVMPDVYSIRLWYRMLGDLPYKVCETALFELFSTHTFPPSISEIRGKCAEYTAHPAVDEGTAWGEVKSAIGRYGIYRTEEALQSMSPAVRKAVERIGFRDICLDENEMATRAHFFRIYKAIVDREKQEAQLPLSVTQERMKYLQSVADANPQRIEQKPEDTWLPDSERADPEKVDKMLKELHERMKRNEKV